MPRCGRRRKHVPDDISPLASVCERRLRVIFVRRKRVEKLTRRKIISVPSIARSASRTWWFVVVSLRSPLFLCKELNLLGTGQEIWQPKFLLRNIRISILLERAVFRIEFLLYCRNQFSTSILCKCSLQWFDWSVYLRVSSNSWYVSTVSTEWASLLCNGHRVFPEGKERPGHDADPSPPSSTEVKNRVELYLHSP